jgi:hypothetical protein
MTNKNYTITQFTQIDFSIIYKHYLSYNGVKKNCM